MSQPLIGQQFGNYSLVHRLGGGGFADVYLGQHVRISSQQAAIKILHLSNVNEQQFMQEAERTASLRDPHIVQLYDFDIQQGMPFLVLEYAPNGSLAKYKGQRLPIEIIIRYVKQIASALQYAHDQNVIHRDIKPENILVNARGELLVSDFGIAVLSKTGVTSLQSAQNVGGTPYYMAPEMFRGKPQKSSDQYSLGIMVYSWFCGKLPFTEGDFIELGYQHTHEPVPSLRVQNPTIAAEIDKVVMLALSKDPKQRFGNIGAFARALEEASQPKPPRATTRQLPSQPLYQHPQQPSVSFTIPVEPINQATPKSIANTLPVSPTPESTLPVKEKQSVPATVPVVSTPPLQKITLLPQIRPRHIPLVKRAMLLGLVLLVLILGSTGIFYWKMNANISRRPTATPDIPATSTANAQAAATAAANVQATANVIDIQATANAQATASAAVSAYNADVLSNGIMFGFDSQRTHYNPYEKILTTTNVSGLVASWEYHTKSQINQSGPAVVDGIVYVGSDDYSLYALDAQSGTKLWSFPTGLDIRSSPAVANGIVYIGSWDHYLYALDAKSGTERWSFPTRGSIWSSPAVVNGMVYVGSDDGSLYALDAQSGTKLWSFPTGGYIEASPAVANGMVYVGSADGFLYALDAKSGTKRWSFSAGASTSPAVVNGMVYVGSADGSLYALDAQSGTKLWSFPTGRDVIEASPAVADGIVYVNNDFLYALDAKSGTKLWKSNDQFGSFYDSAATVANGIIYLGDAGGTLYALDAQSGTKLGSFLTDSSIYSSPVVANGVVYIGTANGTLFAFHLPA